jgi:hypothetical protein
MKKALLFLAIGFGVMAGCDDDDGKQACEAFAQKCPSGAQVAEGEAPLTCDADKVNAASNGAQVEDCIQGAADCTAATACLASLK